MAIEVMVLPLRLAPSIPGVVSVGGAIASGAEIAGAVGGVIGAGVAVVALFVTIAGSNRARRREYEQEIAEAEARGEARYKSDMEFWRGIAIGHISHAGDAIPVPPSQQPPHPRPGERT